MQDTTIRIIVEGKV